MSTETKCWYRTRLLSKASTHRCNAVLIVRYRHCHTMKAKYSRICVPTGNNPSIVELLLLVIFSNWGVRFFIFFSAKVAAADLNRN